MPAWNTRVDWLREAVESALRQRGCMVELIVVDDGSAVPVAEHLREIDDPRLRALRVPHGRSPKARNAGLEAARGRYIRFIDSDDIITEDSTSHLLALTGGDENVVAYGATLVCDESLKPLSVISSNLQGDVVQACLLNRFGTTIHSLLFPRAVVEAAGMWEPSIIVSHDWDFALRAFEIAEVRGDTRIATLYRMHGGMNSRDLEEGVRGYGLVLERYFNRHPEERGGKLHRRAEALFHVFAAVQYARRARSVRRALSHLRQGLALDPRATADELRRRSVSWVVHVARGALAVAQGRR